MRRIVAVGVVFLMGLASGAISAKGADGKLKIAFYRSLGAEGCRQALATSPRFETAIVESLEADTLFKFDAVVLGSAKGLPDAEWVAALEIYAKSGGGVLLHHDATGFRGWKKPLFPDAFTGVDKLRDQTAKNVAADHPIAKGLPKTFAHAYFDHIVQRKGPDGETVFVDINDKPLLIAGKVGSGRVVGNGMLTGFAVIPPKGGQDSAPEGAEKQLLINVLEWLCETPQTRLAPDEVAKRRRQHENALTIRETADVAAGIARKNAANAIGEWFHPSRLNEQGFVHPPVELMPGRFFLFDGAQVAVCNRNNEVRSYKETVAVLWQLRWLGITDLICYTGGFGRFDYPSNVRDAAYTRRAAAFAKQNLNVMERLEKACAETGMSMWCFWHPNMKSVDKKGMETLRNLFVRNAAGAPYGIYVDILNPRVVENAKSALDELADRYNKNGAVKGVFLDELWHPFSVDLMEDDIPAFVAFCGKEYGAAPPADIAAKFALGSKWQEPENVWWRRYVLWRDRHILAFTQTLTKHAETKGLKVMTQPAFPLTWDHAWFSGLGDTKSMAEAGNLLWSYEGRFNFLYEDYPDDRTIFATHTNAHSGFSMTSLVRGNYGSLFTMNGSWAPLLSGKSPRAVEVMGRMVRGNREWFGAKKLDTASALVNEMGLLLRFKNCSRVFKNNDALVRDRLSYRSRTSLTLIDNTAFYDRYKVLIAPKFSLEYLKKDTYAALTDYVSRGGMLILLDGKASVSREDLTDETDKTLELTGIQKGEAEFKLAGAVRFADGGATFVFPAVTTREIKIADPSVKTFAALGAAPLVTLKPMGKGKILSVNFDITGLLADDTSVDEAVRFVTALEAIQAEPAIVAEGNVKIFANLRKGNWVVVTFLRRGVDFYADDSVDDVGKYPVTGKVRLDMKKLGLNFDKFRVYSLARDREMFPQGKYFRTYGETWWNAEILKNEGVDVVLTPDSEPDLKLNYKTDDPQLKRFILPEWDKRYRTRCYEHEIIAIAPVDEPSMLGALQPVKPTR